METDRVSCLSCCNSSSITNVTVCHYHRQDVCVLVPCLLILVSPQSLAPLLHAIVVLSADPPSQAHNGEMENREKEENEEKIKVRRRSRLSFILQPAIYPNKLPDPYDPLRWPFNPLPTGPLYKKAESVLRSPRTGLSFEAVQLTVSKDEVCAVMMCVYNPCCRPMNDSSRIFQVEYRVMPIKKAQTDRGNSSPQPADAVVESDVDVDVGRER